MGGLVREHVDWHRTRYPEPEVGVLGLVRWAPELDVTVFMRWLDMGLQFDAQSIHGIEAGWGRFYGANASLKRAFLERVGDFDQEHFPYGYEDTDWAYRASTLGFRIAVLGRLRRFARPRRRLLPLARCTAPARLAVPARRRLGSA